VRGEPDLFSVDRRRADSVSKVYFHLTPRHEVQTLSGLEQIHETTLPSVASAEDFWNGNPGGLMGVIVSTALRAGLVGVGLAIAGERKNLVKYSLAGALAIEAFVLTSVKYQLNKQSGEK
jgi:hypothetical protein